MTLAELLATLQAQRTGPVVPMTQAGTPAGGRPLTLQEIVNGNRMPNPYPASPMPYPGMNGIRG